MAPRSGEHPIPLFSCSSSSSSSSSSSWVSPTRRFDDEDDDDDDDYPPSAPGLPRLDPISFLRGNQHRGAPCAPNCRLIGFPLSIMITSPDGPEGGEEDGEGRGDLPGQWIVSGIPRAQP